MAAADASRPEGLGGRVLALAGSLVRRLLDVSAGERSAAAGELGRVRTLLGDAVATLQGAFTQLDRTSRAQHSELALLVNRLGGTDGSEGISIHQFVLHTGETLRHFNDLLTQISRQSAAASNKMDDMARAVDEMFALVGRVDDVADRTNLLALNASITAAHAGEAGKAFGVVAAEVKSLSRSSKDLNAALNSQVAVTRRAIDETRNMVRDMASKDVVVAMEANGAIEGMLEKLVVLDQHLKWTLSSVGQASEEISTGVGAAVRALQFEDIATQVLAHVQLRLERLEPLNAIVGAALEPRGEGEAAPEAEARLDQACTELDQAAAENDESDGRHVEQHSMAAGEVDLF